MANRALSGKIAIVTGASRGIGQGIALQLGAAGATVYVTGRQPSHSLGGKDEVPTLEQTAKEITERGGKGIAAYVDHGDMAEVKKFFEKFDKETNGKLDILVNNAYSAVNVISKELRDGRKFYEADPAIWDDVNNVGLRNHYFCSVYAARLMVKNKTGLIINVTSFGGIKYLLNVPYGVGKAAVNRLSADMAVELKSDGVTSVALCPGAVRTQLIVNALKDEKFAKSEMAQHFTDGESIEYSGLAVVALASDKNVIEKTGRVLLNSELAKEYGFVDTDGRLH